MKKILFVTDKMKDGSGDTMFINTFIDRYYGLYDFSVLVLFESQSDEKYKKMDMVHFIKPLDLFKKKTKLMIGEYDVIHFHSLNMVFMFVHILKSKKNLISIGHAHSAHYSNKKLNSIRNLLLTSYSNKYLDVAFSVSKKAEKKWFPKNCEPRFKYVLYNPIKSQLFKFNQKYRTMMREKLHIGNEFVIGHVGRISPEKNHAFIIKLALYLQKNAIFNFKFILVGSGEGLDSLVEEIKYQKLESYFIFLGYVENISQVYNAFDFYVFPSYSEGFGMSFVEAQLNGLSTLGSCYLPSETNISDDASYLSISVEDIPQWSIFIENEWKQKRSNDYRYKKSLANIEAYEAKIRKTDDIIKSVYEEHYKWG